ncbi:MAG: hypothetical protein LRY55_07135, partial [Leadbetterella sp.]|nr:hypothetical protein [Leadbetterella sp.]
EYLVSFNEVREQWELNAGLLSGIYPSLSFMHTLFKLDNGREVSIQNAFDSYSTLMDFGEQDTDNTYSAELIQNALPKLKIGFDPDLDPARKEHFEYAVRQHNIYFIELTENIADAAFLIRSRREEYYLVRNNNYLGEPDTRPVFFYQPDSFEFIKQLEYIAQWQALLELDNSRPVINDEVTIFVNVAEGLPPGPDAKVAKRLINPENVEAGYRNTFSPVISASVELKKEVTPERHFYVHYLYLDSKFGIRKLGNRGDLLKKDSPVVLSEDSSGGLNLVIDDFYIQNKILEIRDYLLVFISTDAVDLNPLLQKPLEVQSHQVITRGVENDNFEAGRRDFVLPRGDWFLKKIPIHIKYDNRSFRKTVEQLVKERPVVNARDQHKERWGGFSMKNGFTLRAKIGEAGRGNNLYNVTLKVQADYGRADSGGVAFLLHESFHEQLMFSKFENNSAEVTVIAYEDFTAAAIVYDGTELELDLSALPGMPAGFYSKPDTLEFNKQVEILLSRKGYADPYELPDDLQKGRWGGKAEQNGKRLSALVVSEGDTHRVSITVETTGEGNFEGKVAFLLHDSFPEKQGSPDETIISFRPYGYDEKIAYREIKDNTASCVLESLEAFTVGAYLSDGTELELDLNDRSLGFPDTFYY